MIHTKRGWATSRREEQGWWVRACIPLSGHSPFSPSHLYLFTHLYPHCRNSASLSPLQPDRSSPQRTSAQGCPKRRAKTLHYLCFWWLHIPGIQRVPNKCVPVMACNLHFFNVYCLPSSAEHTLGPQVYRHSP